MKMSKNLTVQQSRVINSGQQKRLLSNKPAAKTAIAYVVTRFRTRDL